MSGFSPPRLVDLERLALTGGALLVGAPSMGTNLRVKVPPRGGQPGRSEPPLREGERPWGGSGERDRGAMDENPIRGGAERGERVEAQAA